MSLIPSLADRIFVPIRSVIERVLPDFAESALHDPAVRKAIVLAADTTLIHEFPAARALPSDLRRRLIARVLDHVLGAETPAGRAAGAEKALTTEALGISDEETALLEASAPGNSIRGFVMDGEAADDAAVRAAVAGTLGEGWTVERLDPEFAAYRATNPDAVLSVPAAWTLSHELERTAAIARAEPEIEWVPAPPEIGGPAPDVRANLRSVAGINTHLSCSKKSKSWHLDIIHADLAWQFSRKLGRPEKGAGVTIGHLDTGVTNHAEVPLRGGHIHIEKGANFYDPDNKIVGNRPLDPMDSDMNDMANVRFKTFDGHGTGTVSMITGSKVLTGSAPAADVIPFRVAPTVVHFNLTRITQGIRAAHLAGCDVISMSMGGQRPNTNFLQDVVAAAVEDGVIICTAAGNVIGSNDVLPLVVWPAALDQVIAVAGCNCEWQKWSGSSRGREVNITAPAQDVWHAIPQKGALPPATTEGVNVARGDGTSFATPTVAGMAACWLAHHGGRKALAERYGHPRYVPQAFAWLLRNKAFFTPKNWDTERMGPGIFDASALLRASLPAKSSLNGWPRKEHPTYAAWVSTVAGWIGSRSRSAAAPAADPETELGGLAGELGYLLFDRPQLVEMLAAPPAAEGIRAASRSGSDGFDEAAALLGTTASEQLARALRLRPPAPVAVTRPHPGAPARPAPTAPAEWTILIFMAGDNNLDDFGHQDLLEMKKGLGPCDSIHVLVQRDTSAAGVDTMRYRITGSPDLAADVVQNLGETNTGDPRVLQDFLTWGLKNYPAKRTMAVLWNHGAGWDDTDIYAAARDRGLNPEPPRPADGANLRGGMRGALPPGGFVRGRAVVGGKRRGSFFLTAFQFAKGSGPRRAIAFDDHAQDFLDNEEMKKVFETVSQVEGRKFDIIGMDACLMSMVETGYQIRNGADILCASQEVEPVEGWPYDRILGTLATKPTMTPEELGRLIVNEFVASYSAAKPVTQSLTSLAEIGTVVDAVNALGKVLAAGLETDDGIVRALRRARRGAQTYETKDYIDLGHFCSLLESSAPTLAPVTGGVRDALAKCVLANAAPNPAVAASTGLSVYFPTNGMNDLYRKLDFGNGAWADFIAGY